MPLISHMRYVQRRCLYAALLRMETVPHFEYLQHYTPRIHFGTNTNDSNIDNVIGDVNKARVCVEGTVRKFIYRADNGFTVARILLTENFAAKWRHILLQRSPKHKIINWKVVTVAGIMPLIDEGQLLYLEGEWEKHEKFGMQLHVEKFQTVQNLDSLKNYIIRKIPGVGPTLSKAIVDEFGQNSILILRNNPELVNSRVKWVTLKRAHKISQILQNETQENLRQLLNAGIPQEIALDIVASFKNINSLRSILMNDPYQLCWPPKSYFSQPNLEQDQSKGCSVPEWLACASVDSPILSFSESDIVAQKLGLSGVSLQRIKAAILTSLENALDFGHCFLPISRLIDWSHNVLTYNTQSNAPTQWQRELAGIDFEKEVESALQSLVSSGLVAVETRDENDARVYLSSLYNAEWSIAFHVHKRCRKIESTSMGYASDEEFTKWITKWINEQEVCLGITLSDDQKAAIFVAATHQSLILTGGPGSGKTTITSLIVSLWKELGISVALCAPTGRAAQRLAEASRYPASTIHRLLGSDVNGSDFLMNENNKLEAQALVIDEASMLDICLADALLKATQPQCRILFVGDSDQLASVGPGNVLSHLISSSVVPCHKLESQYRQVKGSMIAQCTQSIIQGKWPPIHVLPLNSDGFDASDKQLENGMRVQAANEILPECIWIPVNSMTQAENSIRETITTLLPRAGIDVISELQVLTPMKRGALGTLELNQMLQNLINPIDADGKQLQKMIKYQGMSNGVPMVFRTGDKVIQHRNNYQLDLFNGDVGMIEQIDFDSQTLYVRYTDTSSGNAPSAKKTESKQFRARANIPTMQPNAPEKSKNEAQNTRLVEINRKNIRDVELAWSITVHKAQGTEYPAVVLILLPHQKAVLSRRLIYTAFSRAKQNLVVIGAKSAIEQGLGSVNDFRRHSMLEQRLQSQKK